MHMFKTFFILKTLHFGDNLHLSCVKAVGAIPHGDASTVFLNKFDSFNVTRTSSGNQSNVLSHVMKQVMPHDVLTLRLETFTHPR